MYIIFTGDNIIESSSLIDHPYTAQMQVATNGYYFDNMFVTSIIIIDLANYQPFYSYYSKVTYTQTYLFTKSLNYISRYNRNQKLLSIFNV